MLTTVAGTLFGSTSIFMAKRGVRPWVISFIWMGKQNGHVDEGYDVNGKYMYYDSYDGNET